MKIIFVISAMNGGGSERVLATLANRYAAQGDEVTILMVAGDESAYPLDEHVRILSVGQPSNGNPLVQLKRLAVMRKYFKEHRGSTIVSFGTEINLFTILSAVGLPNKVIVSERNDPNRCRYKSIRNLIYSFCKNFVFQTRQAGECFPEQIRKRGIVISNPIRKELPDPCNEIREKKIAAVGRLEPQKNHMLLLEAFAGFHRRYPEYELHIFGMGSLKQKLEEAVKKLEIENSVYFEGFRSDILETIRTYSMYVLSSDYEGISNSLMEAMALGLPCVATDCPIGGSAVCIRDGKNGLLVPTGDAAALCQAMEQLAGDCGFAEKIGRKAIEIRERFAEEKIADMWKTAMKNGKGRRKAAR